MKHSFQIINKITTIFIFLLLLGVYQSSFSQTALGLYSQFSTILSQKNYSQATQIITLLESRFPNDSITLNNLQTFGWCYLQTGDYSNAITRFNKYISKNPNGNEIDKAYLNLGFCHKQQSHYDLATSVFSTMISQCATSNWLDGAYLNLGYCAQALGDYSTAGSAYQNYIQKGYTNTEYSPDVYFNAGYCSQAYGNYTQAVSGYKQYIAKYPNDNTDRLPTAYFNLANCAQKGGDYAKAITYYKLYLSKYPQGKLARNATKNLPVCYMYTKTTTEAYPLYQQMVNDPSNPPDVIARAWINLGELYMNAGQSSKAIDSYNSALSISGVTTLELIADARLFMGFTQIPLQQYTDAINQFQAITSLNISSHWNTLAENGLGRVYLTEGNYIQAQLQFQHIIATYTTETQQQALAQYLIGECFLRQNQNDNALAAFQKVISDYPNTNAATSSQNIINNINNQSVKTQ